MSLGYFDLRVTLPNFPPVGMLQRKVEEVTQVFEHRRRQEQDRNIRIAFD